MIDPAVLSLFESQHAGPHSPQHIRRVDIAGFYFGSGLPVRVLCGRRITGWDIEGPVTFATVAANVGSEVGPTCPRCAEFATAILRDPTDPNAGEPDAPVVASAPVQLRRDTAQTLLHAHRWREPDIPIVSPSAFEDAERFRAYILACQEAGLPNPNEMTPDQQIRQLAIHQEIWPDQDDEPIPEPSPVLHYAPALGRIMCPQCGAPVLSLAGYAIDSARITHDLAEVTCTPTV